MGGFDRCADCYARRSPATCSLRCYNDVIIVEGLNVSARKVLGRFIAIDPQVRHCAPSFWGTDLTVRDVVERVATEQDGERLIDRSEGALSRRAIAEALALRHCRTSAHRSTSPPLLCQQTTVSAGPLP